MAKETTAFNCLVGNPVYNTFTGQWECADDTGRVIKNAILTKPAYLPYTPPSIPADSNGNIIYYINGQPQAQAAQTATGGFDFSAFFSDNKWLILAGVGLLGYFFLSGGLSASDRTVTSVTRFGRKQS